MVAVLAVSAIASIASATSQVTALTTDVKQIQKLFDRGETDAAEKQLWEVLKRDPQNAGAINLLGAIRTKQKRFLEAESLFKRALMIAPDLIVAYRNLGELYVLRERRDDAKAAYLKAHELAPDDAKTSLALGSIYEETGEFQRSIEIIQSIPPRRRSSETLPILASDYIALKQPDKVNALIPPLRRAAVTDLSLMLRFCQVLLKNGFVNDAGELLKTATPRQKMTPEYLLVLARLQESEGNVGSAQRTLDRVSKLDPHSFGALFQSARLASQAKDYKKEAVLLGKAMEIQPDDVELLRHLVVALMRSGDAVRAVVTARHLYSLQRQDPDALYLLSAAMANHAEWHDARLLAQKLLTVRDDATAHVLLGMTLMNDGDIEGASRQIELALLQNPNEIEAHYYRGVIARERGNRVDAIKEMEIVVAADPHHGLAQVELGTLALQTGELDRARQALEQAVSIRPDLPENHYQLGLAYTRLGLQEKARAQMTEFEKLKNDAANAKSALSHGTAVERRPAP